VRIASGTVAGHAAAAADGWRAASPTAARRTSPAWG